MAIIVEHKETKNKFVLLGTGYGAYKATRPSFFGGNLLPHEDEDTIQTVAVCDKEGTIHWLSDEEVRVIEIDGTRMNDIKL